MKKKPKKSLAAAAVDKAAADAAAQESVDRKPEGRSGGEVVTLRSRTIRTLADALEAAEVDTEAWDVERYLVNKWDCVAKCATDTDGAKVDELRATELWQVKVWLKPKHPWSRALESLHKRIKAGSPVCLTIKRPRIRPSAPRRALEVCVMDPHLGLQCFRPGSDLAWSLDECEEKYLWAIEGLLKRAEAFGPFREILWVFGNDYLHADTVWNTTTAGTAQPESVAWHAAYERGVRLAITAGDRLKQVAPLRIVQVSGNHDRLSSFTLGWVLWAYYARDKNVEVDVSPSPYKFWRWGVNLVGLDHGHSKKLERLAALMANECAAVWAETRYREWHLGDQHRKGSGRPAVLAEQGVGVEFLTGLTPANEWHKLKTYNWQPRGAVAYVWDARTGPEARLHVNLDLYTGQPLNGASALQTPKGL